MAREESHLACRAAEALLGATTEGTTSLLLGGGCERLAAIIPRLGGEILKTDLPASSTAGLRHPDGAFDTIFAPRFFAVGPCSGGHPAARLLSECRRVLKPGGRLVLWASHARGVGALVGLMQRLATSPARSFLPHRLVAGVMRRSGDLPALRYTPDQLAAVLREAGFARTDAYLSWPRSGIWELLIPRAGASIDGLPGAPTRLRATLRSVRLAARQFGLEEWLTPNYCVAAAAPPAESHGGSVPAPETLLERLLGDLGLAASEANRVTLHAQGERVVTFAVGDHFFKVPVVPSREERIRDEVRANDHVRTIGVRDLAITYSHFGQVGRVPFLVFPKAEPLEHHGRAEQSKGCDAAFDALARGAAPLELRRTDAWARVFECGSIERLTRLGGTTLLEGLAAACGDKRAPTGTVHGDLNLSNILRRDGRIALIDWDRFEAASPVFLDRFNLVLRWMLRRLGPGKAKPHRVLLERLFRRDPGIPLLRRIDEVAGELTWEELVAFYVLSAANWRLAQAPAAGLRLAESEVRDQLQISLRHWSSAEK